MQIHNAAVTGSFTYNGIDISDITGSEQSVTSLNDFSASILNYTSSNNQSIASLNAASASLFAATASLSGATASLFNYTSSNTMNIANLFATSASLNASVAQIQNATSSLYAATASLYAATASLYNATASIYGATSSLFNFSSSATLRINALDQYTASLNTRSASFACTTATNNFACTQYFSNTSNAVSFTSTGSLYSDGGVRITRDMYVSGTAFFNNVTVFGTQSINYISSSQLNIASNIISVNTATPTVRFGGLAVYDSGSLGTGLTGSLLWDSEDNQWIYSNPSGSTYDSAVFLVGPRSTGPIGSEVGITCNFLSKGNGLHHMTASAIFDDGSRTCFYGSGFITSTGVSCFTTSCAASIVGGSISGTTGTFSSNVVATGSLIIAPSSNVELQVQSTGVTIGNLAADNHNVTGSLRVSGSFNTVGNVCATSICSPAFVGGTVCGTNGTLSGTLGVGTNTPSNLLELYCNNAASGNYSDILSITAYNSTITNGNGAALVFKARSNAANPFLAARIYTCMTNGGTGTEISSLVFQTINSGTISDKLTITGAGVACFSSTVCSPTFVGGTISGTTGTFSGNVSISVNQNALSRLVISNTTAGTGAYVETSFTSDTSAGAGAVGKFGSSTTPYKITTASNTYLYNSSTAGDIAILNDFASGAIKMAAGGSSTPHFIITSAGVACFSSAVCSPNLISTDATHCTIRMACRIVPLSNYRTSDCGYGGIDFFDNGKGYACSAKFYTFTSTTSEWYGMTNDYGAGASAQLALISCGGGAGNNISFFTGTSTTARLRIDNNASNFSQVICAPSAALVQSTSGCTLYVGQQPANASSLNGLILLQSGTIPQSGGDTTGQAGLIFNHSYGTGGVNGSACGGYIRSIRTDVFGVTSQVCTALVFGTTAGNVDNERLRITATGIACFAGTVCAPSMVSAGLSTTSCFLINSNSFFNSDVRMQVCGKSAYDGIVRFINCCNQGDVNHGILHLVNSLPYAIGNDASLAFSTMGTDAYPHPRASIGVKTTGNQSGALVFNTRESTWEERLRINDSGIACFRCQICAPSGVKFGNGSTTLNYYEEGSWTPALQNATVSYSERSGTYVRIGNYVFVRWGFRISSISGQSGTVQISGLPFTAVNWGSYQEPNVSVSTGILVTADYAQRARMYKGGSDTSLYGRIADNGDTSWNTSQLQNGSWIIGEIYYNV